MLNEYFQNKLHGSNALRTDIEIFPYDGADNLKNTILMNFIKIILPNKTKWILMSWQV